MLIETLAVVLLRSALVALGVVGVCALGGWAIPFVLAGAEAYRQASATNSPRRAT